MTRRTRKVCVVLCAAWLCFGLAHVAWALGHPVDGLSLAVAVVAGVAGLIGLVSFVLQWRADSRAAAAAARCGAQRTRTTDQSETDRRERMEMQR